MTADWTKPGTGSTKTSFPTEIIAIASDAARMDYVGSTNVPSGAMAYNRTTDQLEEWNGSTWSTAPVGVPVGAVMQWLSNTAPTGYLLLQGGTIGNAASGGTLRANADCSQLFEFLWTNLANAQAAVSSGRGASAAADFAANKTITVPDMRQRFPIGTAASGTGATLGGTGGNIDHTHSVPAHYHGMGTGATLNITSSGSGTSGAEAAHTHSINHDHAGFTCGPNGQNHTHSFTGKWNNVASGTSFTAWTQNAFTDTITTAVELTTHAHAIDVPAITATSGAGSSHTHTTPAHTHPAGNFAGTIGLVTGGVDGNAVMTSGTGNPAFLALNFIIKF
jgi:hypothetical protein